MATALTMLFIIAGLLVIWHSFFYGLVLIGVGALFSRMRSARDEERLVAFLAILAAVGVAFTFGKFIIEQLPF